MTESIPNYILEKAVDLWCEALHNPTFENGDTSHIGTTTVALMSQLAELQRGKINFESELEKFRTNLLILLKNHVGPDRNMRVDYEPWGILKAACIGTEISDNMFPIKSEMRPHKDHVMCKFGYAKIPVFYYPVLDEAGEIAENWKIVEAT